MRDNNSWITSSILIICDGAIILGILRLAVLLRNLLTPLFGNNILLWQKVVPLAQMGILFGIAVFFFQGLYPGFGLTAVKELEIISKSTTIVFFSLAAVSYLNKPYQDISRASILLFWFLSLIILPINHFLMRNILSRFSWYGIPVTIFGEPREANQISTSLGRVRRLGWNKITILPLQEINRLAKAPSDRIAIIVSSNNEQTNDYIRNLSSHFKKVLLVPSQKSFGSLWVEPRDLDGRLGLEFRYHLLDQAAMGVKRAIDIVGSLFLLCLLSPILVIVTVLIFIDDHGPILFRQLRTGKNYLPFKVNKFRTMEVNAEQKLQKLFLESSELKAEFEQYHKLKSDPRLTRVGVFLRRFYLDEIPQLWNVFVGEMSLIGPRPMVEDEIDKIRKLAPIILRVKPGMTGWWQVVGRHEVEFQERVQMEEYYISNWSLWMDVYILLKTVWVVFSGRGA